MKTEKLPVKSVLFAVVFLLYWCYYLQLQSLVVSEFVFFFSYQWFEVLVQIIDSILLSSLEYGRQGGFMGVTLKCPLLSRMKKWHPLLYNCAACTVLHKMLSQWTRSPAFETNSHSLCSTWIENIISYLCSLGLPTVLGDRWVYILKENFILHFFWLNKCATHLNSLCFII